MKQKMIKMKKLSGTHISINCAPSHAKSPSLPPSLPPSPSTHSSTRAMSRSSMSGREGKARRCFARGILA